MKILRDHSTKNILYPADNFQTYPTGVRDASAEPLTADAKTATRAESAKVAATREPEGSHLRLCTTPPALKQGGKPI